MRVKRVIYLHSLIQKLKLNKTSIVFYIDNRVVIRLITNLTRQMRVNTEVIELEFTVEIKEPYQEFA
jgi:hypothetical protein